MTSLITGAGGFVGEYLTNFLASQGENVVKTESREIDDSFLLMDVLNLENCKDIINKTSPDVIYHLAGIASPQVCEKDFSLALNVNVLGTYNILKTAKESEKEIKVIVISSAQCYGKPIGKELFTEESACNPSNNYGITKVMAEEVSKKFMQDRESNLKIVIARPFNHIGPKQREGFVLPDFATKIAKIKMGIMEPKIIVGDLSAIRDFTDVRDVVRGYYLLAQKGEGVYNLCSQTPHKVRDLLDILVKVSGVNVEIIEDKQRFAKGAGANVFLGSYQKIKEELGWIPEISFEKSVTDTYEYILNELSRDVKIVASSPQLIKKDININR